jgi:CheY-like chemotaxis protein
VKADGGQIGQLLVNLATNARDAMPEGGTFTISARPTGPPPGETGRWAMLSASDTGAGIDPGVARNIFEPFFTTKEVGKGSGLGLAIVHGIVTQHGGTVSVESEPGKGSVFRVLLPLTDSSEAGPAEARRGVRPACGAGVTVLLVEDEGEVRKVIRLALEEGGYRVLEAADGEEALRRLAEDPGRLSLLVSDVVMPGMNGLALVEAARKARPGLPALLMSGYSEEVIRRKGALPGGVSLLEKPAPPEAILRAVADTIAGAAARAGGPAAGRGESGKE